MVLFLTPPVNTTRVPVCPDRNSSTRTRIHAHSSCITRIHLLMHGDCAWMQHIIIFSSLNHLSTHIRINFHLIVTKRSCCTIVCLPLDILCRSWPWCCQPGRECEWRQGQLCRTGLFLSIYLSLSCSFSIVMYVSRIRVSILGLFCLLPSQVGYPRKKPMIAAVEGNCLAGCHSSLLDQSLSFSCFLHLLLSLLFLLLLLLLPFFFFPSSFASLYLWFVCFWSYLSRRVRACP